MTHSAPTRSWLSSEKRNDVEFFKKLHMLRDDLHLKERANLKSAIARIESKKYRRNNQLIEREGKYGRGYDELKPVTRTSEISELTGVQQWKDGRLFEIQDEAVKPWDRGQRLKSTFGDQSVGQRSGQGHSGFKEQPLKKRNGQLKRINANQKHSDKRMFSLTDNTIARIATNMNDFEGDKSSNFMRNPDHLPSIPRVGHRVSITHRNRLKAMTWESEFSEIPNISKKETKAQVKGSLESKKLPEKTTIRRENRDRKREGGLLFSVNPRDKDVFKNLNREVLPATPSTPAPPVNSRVTGSTAVPVILLPEETAEVDVDGGEVDSLRSFGALNNAMKKFVTAHEDFENLKEELETIAHMNESLEKIEDVEGCSTKL